MSSCRLNHSDISRACDVIGSLLSTLEHDSPDAGDSDMLNLREGLSAMQSTTFSNLIDVRLAHQRTLSSAYAFLAASSSSLSSEDDEFDDDEVDPQDVDSPALRYGIQANRNRLPTPEPTSGIETCVQRSSSSLSMSSASGMDSQDERVLEKLRGIEMANETKGAVATDGVKTLVQPRTGKRRDPLGSLDSSASSVEPPPFMSSRRTSQLEHALFNPPSRPASGAATPLHATHVRQTSGDSSRDGSLARKLATNQIRDSLGDLDESRLMTDCPERVASPGLSDSLVFLRRKSSLSEVEQAISGRRRRTVTVCVPHGAELGLEAMGSAHHGLFVSDVERHSHADAAGLRLADQLLSVDGRSLVGVASTGFARLVQERESNEIVLIVQQNRAGMEEFSRSVASGYSED